LWGFFICGTKNKKEKLIMMLFVMLSWLIAMYCLNREIRSAMVDTRIFQLEIRYRVVFRLNDGTIAHSRHGLAIHQLPIECRVHSSRGFDHGVVIGLEII
jgi:hypothetical protein